ncbi:hypothetical protein AB0B30_32640 [Streptomyces narbonensis]|uniref:Uncharacterized protein n=1 Tax=Streptomyces narbonensis TaxID=67333 RepID=A0ABV3CKC0_9ACTN
MFEYRDNDGARLAIDAVNASTYYGNEPVVALLTEHRDGDDLPVVYVPLDRVEEVVAGIRDAARQASGQQPDTRPAYSPVPLTGLRIDRIATVSAPAAGLDDTQPANDLRRLIARAIHRYDNQHALSGNDMPSEHHYGEADAVLAALGKTTTAVEEDETR